MDNDSRQIYQNIFENLSDGVIVIGFDSKIDTCNDAACEILGIERGSAVGKNLAELMIEIEGKDALFEMLIDAVYTKEKISKTVSWGEGSSLRYIKVTTTYMIEDSSRTALIAVLSDQTEVTNLLIRNQKLASQVTALMNSFVEVMVTAFEEKSAYNANHTKSMARYATKYLTWLEERGELEDKTSSNTGALVMSVWLHDIGKLLIPQEVMDKPTRLGPEITCIRHRAEVAKLMFENKKLSGSASEKETEDRIRQLDECMKLIEEADSAPFLDDDTIARLHEAAGTECLASDGTSCPLLDPAELKSITVARGTLTDEEREIIKSHVILTERLLSKMQFVGDYKQVPEWASEHHECLDGTGYPKKFAADKIPWEARFLSVIDIFDALTADDRPYKAAIPPDKAFEILRNMASEGKIDGNIVESFYQSEAWKHDII